VATDELAIGDNDTLSAIVAVSAGADLLVLLSDIDGLYTANPHEDSSATLLTEIHGITPELFALAGGKGSSLGTGGMVTKLKAAKLANDAGIDMIIANGSDPEILYTITEGKPVGTRFIAG
ncbi:MAG: glutamate 5-kinase, partial [Oscillospiraceae bacterium]|nr:glutamate 5-kinase [Oscillospiraceae bacterium]